MIRFHPNHPRIPHAIRPTALFLALLLAALACNMPVGGPAASNQPATPGPQQSSSQPPAPQSPAASQSPATPRPQTPSSSPDPLTLTPLSVPPTSPPPSQLPPTSSPSSSQPPVFSPSPCPFAVPDGYAPLCGYLVVPENRARPGGASVRLAVAVFRSTASNPAPDPVVYLSGGPGSSALDEAGYLFSYGMDAVLARRDLVLFDQRGTGASQPRLDCPENAALTPALLEGSLPPGAVAGGLQACHDRLVASGIDLEAYSSASSAADVNDLRLAFGYPQLDLYGVSYGTRLALTVMRDFPEAVRSVVLDSTYPPQVNLYTALAPNAERAFNVLFERCAYDPACNAAFPDLKTVFYTLVDELNAAPIAVHVQASGEDHLVQVDGRRLIDVLFTGLYNPQVAARMPGMIYAIRQGRYNFLRTRLELYFDTSNATGMQMAVQCNEELPFNAPEEAYTQAQGVQPQIAAFFPANVQSLWEACKTWRTTPPNPIENQPVSSALPTLILAGDGDPITPPAWGQLAASTLSQAYFYEFPGNGHWVTRSSACALQMALAFWDDPSAAPNSACIGSN